MANNELFDALSCYLDTLMVGKALELVAEDDKLLKRLAKNMAKHFSLPDGSPADVPIETLRHKLNNMVSTMMEETHAYGEEYERLGGSS